MTARPASRSLASLLLVGLALALASGGLVASPRACAQEPDRLEDPFLEQLVGRWTGEGTQNHPLTGEPVPYRDALEVSWALGHRWLRFQLRAVQGGAVADYQAEGFLTRPPAKRQAYTMSWMDVERRVNVANGKLAPDGKTLVLRATDPGGSTVVTTYVLDGAALKLTMALELDGQTVPLLEVKYTRAPEGR